MKPGRRLRVVIALLAGFHAVVLLSGFFAPYDPTEQNRDVPFAPPTRVHWENWRPHVCRWSSPARGDGPIVEDCAQRYRLRLFVREAPREDGRPVSPRRRLFGVDPPGRIFLLGTDAFGRDVFSRLLDGGRISLIAGLLAAGISVFLGLLLGSVAGFYGGGVDAGMMRVADLFFALPWVYLLLAVRAFLPLSIGPARAFLLVVAILGIVGWARPARLVRGVVLSAKNRKYVAAARGFGGSDLYVLRRHVLPQTGGVVATHAAILAPQYVLGEVTLSFLGLGVAEPAASWGNMLASAQQYHALAAHPWILAPGFALVPVLFCYSALADALQKRFVSVAL